MHNCNIGSLLQLQADLIIRGLFSADLLIHKCKISLKGQISCQSVSLLSAKSLFAVQNCGTYLPRITRLTCTFNYKIT